MTQCPDFLHALHKFRKICRRDDFFHRLLLEPWKMNFTNPKKKGFLIACFRKNRDTFYRKLGLSPLQDLAIHTIAGKHQCGLKGHQLAGTFQIHTEMLHNRPKFRMGHINGVIIVFAVTTLAVFIGILPGPFRGCLHIHPKTPIAKFQDQGITPSQRKAPNVPDRPVHSPSPQRTE